MRSSPHAPLSIALVFVTALLTGCGSLGSGRSHTASYQAMNCIELNNGIADTANGIGRAAITRENINVPFWIPGGARAKTRLQDRQTARIERLRQEQAVLKAARASRCP